MKYLSSAWHIVSTAKQLLPTFQRLTLKVEREAATILYLVNPPFITNFNRHKQGQVRTCYLQ